MSKWSDWNMEERIREVLNQTEKRNGQRALMTAYQITIAICKKDDSFLELTGKLIGDEDQPSNSLAVYISRELSKRIRDQRIHDMEIFYLSKKYIDELEYIDHEGNEIETTTSTLFRLKD
ncbi:hypothetical protein GCM10011571_35520 [Marinithermofilum abyssi]|uniref:Uncharacterized protein n=1 Tax=Marinithermofilum abyssi TaxID=1571185 RepID=A0A8J2VKL3_9BACL|nr:hypothetical protein [Marinithermofilum abyssi]GGE30204.1 hypothetical protein GCM10011571_35520 [Marinithermofilum abyssi]